MHFAAGSVSALTAIYCRYHTDLYLIQAHIKIPELFLKCMTVNLSFIYCFFFLVALRHYCFIHLPSMGQMR